MLGLDCVENSEVFLKQLLAVISKEKTSVQKDPNIDFIESFMKLNSKLIVIPELPNVLKNNRKSMGKFEKIQRILEFTKKLANC